MSAHELISEKQPVAIIGSGDLVAHLYRGDDFSDSGNYRFGLVRFCPDLEATHELRPQELKSMIKLCQVLAFTIADDGWLPWGARKELVELASNLDELTQRWSETKDG